MTDLITAAHKFVLSPHYSDMTLRNLAMLSILCDEDGPHQVKALAQKLRVQKPIITRSANFLEMHLRYVRRIRHPTDRRIILVEVTEQGRAFREICRHATAA